MTEKETVNDEDGKYTEAGKGKGEENEKGENIENVTEKDKGTEKENEKGEGK